MDRNELGSRMCQWHSSMHDPVYAVGSFYVSGQVYPDAEMVENAIARLTRDCNQFKTMLAGEEVRVMRNGQSVSLKKFAGYTDEQMNEHVADLEEIISSLKQFQTKDYR